MRPSENPPQADIVIAHDYLTQRGGAERVVLALHRMYPEAPIYTTLYDPQGTFPEFNDATIITSPLNKIGLFRKNHRLALPLLPLAAWMVKVPTDTAIVSSSGWAHGFRFTGKTVVYCHTPARWIYLLEEYLGSHWWREPQGVLATAMRPFLRAWDYRAMARREIYLGNSTVVTERIRRIYGRDDVGLVHPPHDVDTLGAIQPIPGIEEWADGQGYYLVVSRLLPYKNVDAVIKAAEMTGQRLLVVGRGPHETHLKAVAGPNVKFAQDLSEPQLRWAYAHATSLVAVSYEDFGITPLEASAWGKP
ncbi:glycosyltransferase, partial [Kocuria sp.]|uniref:glycosyltransferase n=1 Tax=Kocuria sp. TaxID=1871328 RepID=UPI0026DFF141